MKSDDLLSSGNDSGTHVHEEEEEAQLWREMAFAQESSKVTVENSQDNDLKEKEDDCEHSFIYRDDTGEVCCVCGLIKTHIARMIQVVFHKSGNCSVYDKGAHLYGVSEEEEEAQLWREMAFAQESFKVTVENSQANDCSQIEDCEHSFIYKDDIGEVCCVCGLIKTPIASIIEVVYNNDMSFL